jgi:hypothetical protein
LSNDGSGTPNNTTGHNNNTGIGEDWQAEYTNAITQIKYHDGQKAKYIFIAIEALIGSGLAKNKIAAKLYKDLQGYASEAYIRELCARKGCTDDNYTRDEYKEVIIGADGNVLPAAHTDSSSGTNPDSAGGSDYPGAEYDVDKTRQANASTEPNYALQNRPYIDHLQNNIELLQEIVKKLKKGAFFYDAKTGKPNFTEDDLKEIDEYMQLSNQLAELTAQAFDDRNTIPTPTQIHLCELVVQTSIKHATGVYISKVKQLFGLSSKQVTKTLKGVIRDVHFLYEPTTRDEALLDGFYGKQCKTCQSWRVRYDFGGSVHCYQCESEYHVDAELLNQESKEPEPAAEGTT